MSFLVKTSLPQVTGTEAEAGCLRAGKQPSEISACPGTLMALQALLVGGLHSLVRRWGHGQLASFPHVWGPSMLVLWRRSLCHTRRTHFRLSFINSAS